VGKPSTNQGNQDSVINPNLHCIATRGCLGHQSASTRVVRIGVRMVVAGV
jgi:hypothetical protein